MLNLSGIFKPINPPTNITIGEPWAFGNGPKIQIISGKKHVKTQLEKEWGNTNISLVGISPGPYKAKLIFRNNQTKEIQGHVYYATPQNIFIQMNQKFSVPNQQFFIPNNYLIKKIDITPNSYSIKKTGFSGTNSSNGTNTKTQGVNVTFLREGKHKVTFTYSDGTSNTAIIHVNVLGWVKSNNLQLPYVGQSPEPYMVPAGVTITSQDKEFIKVTPSSLYGYTVQVLKATPPGKKATLIFTYKGKSVKKHYTLYANLQAANRAYYNKMRKR